MTIMPIIVVDTDYDFGIVFDGREYCDSSFAIQFDTPEQVSQMELLGPFGSPGPPSKSWDWELAVEKIQYDPDTGFNDRGGNRGVAYYP
jgi:hypothetical protein